MMKPKGQTEHDEGMLEYLEDIIGSCRLKEPIQTLTRRIEILNEQRGEKVTHCVQMLLICTVWKETGDSIIVYFKKCMWWSHKNEVIIFQWKKKFF